MASCHPASAQAPLTRPRRCPAGTPPRVNSSKPTRGSCCRRRACSCIRGGVAGTWCSTRGCPWPSWCAAPASIAQGGAESAPLCPAVPLPHLISALKSPCAPLLAPACPLCCWHTGLPLGSPPHKSPTHAELPRPAFAVNCRATSSTAPLPSSHTTLTGRLPGLLVPLPPLALPRPIQPPPPAVGLHCTAGRARATQPLPLRRSDPRSHASPL